MCRFRHVLLFLLLLPLLHLPPVSELELAYDEVVYKKSLKTKEMSHLTNELQEIDGNVGVISSDVELLAD